MRVELLVAGAGPAGMAAALAAADAGCDVLLVDAGRAVGGQIHRQPSTLADGQLVGDGLPARFHRVARHERVVVRPGTVVWQAEGQGGDLRVWLGGGGRTEVVRAGAGVVATGATELVLPFPGWTLPGVMTAGAGQALVKGHGVLPGRRVLVAGTGPFLLPVAATLAAAGAQVTVAEAARLTRRPLLLGRLAGHPAKALEAASYLATLARHRVRWLRGRALASCEGGAHVERARLVGTGSPRRAPLELEVDAVCAGHGFVPALELPRALGCAERPHPDLPQALVAHDADQATSVPGVFVAGEACGVGGADVAELEGTVAGIAAARFLGRPAAAVPARVRGRLARARRFARLLEALYPPSEGWVGRLTGDTVVCRCEDATWGQVRAAAAAGAADLRTVKGLTRSGMGYCQGRTCGPPLQLALRALTGRPLAALGDLQTRTLGQPVPLADIARWGGEP